MLEVSASFQPLMGSSLAALETSAARANWEGLFVAVAYATEAGVGQLIGAIEDSWPGWQGAKKQFIVGLDFGLTEPEGLEYLGDLPNSECFIYRARATLAAGLRPQACYHPKVYAFLERSSIRRSDSSSGLIGSVNLTFSALTGNVESFVSFASSRNSQPGTDWIESLVRLQKDLLRDSEALSGPLLKAYRGIRPKRPSPASDYESVPAQSPRSDLDPSTIRAVRSARYLWTQTLKIVENLGHGNPGNQVDLKKGARVFFGSKTPLHAPPNTALGSITTVYAGTGQPCALRHGDNGMDKVNLPIPGGENPPRYDYSFLLWKRISPGVFELNVDSTGVAWRKASERAGSIFKYAGGKREWGFFNKL